MMVLLLLLTTISISLAAGLIEWQQRNYSSLRFDSLDFHPPSIADISDTERQLNDLKSWVYGATNSRGEILFSERKILEKNPQTILNLIKQSIVSLSERQSFRQLPAYNRVADAALDHITKLTELITVVGPNDAILAENVNRLIRSLTLDFLQWRQFHEIGFVEDEIAFNEFKEKTNQLFYLILVLIFIITVPVTIIFIRRINTTLTQLESTQNKLSKLTQTLESKVEERTKEISQIQDQLIRNERLAALGQLTGTVSHELRNPLGTINTSLFTLRNKFKLENIDAAKSVDRIERSVKRCDDIVEDLLQYSRVQELHLELIDFEEWIMGILGGYKNRPGLSIEYEIEPVGVIKFDSHRLRRVFINLFDNAVRAMSIKNEITPGSILKLKITSDKLGISIAVFDNGSGISDDDLPHIFEPLFSTHAFGIGLGLPTVSQILEHHGGTINVDTSVKEGACFRCWLPYENVKEEVQ